MGSMKRKRRKKLAKLWLEFQEHFGLSDGRLKQARSLGFPPEALKKQLTNATSDTLSVDQQIRTVCQQHKDKQAERQAAIESGEIQAKPKKKKKKPAHDPMWAKAKQVCRLNMEDIRMAKELAMTPKTLMKNVPSSSQKWKSPVRDWIRDLYQQRSQDVTCQAEQGFQSESAGDE